MSIYLQKRGCDMFIEEKIDKMLTEQARLIEMVKLFLPNLETEKGVVHFLEITKNTFNTYLSDGVFIEGVHFVKNGKTRVFVPEEIIKLKKSGVKGKRKMFSKQDEIDTINQHLGIISTCRHAS